MCYFAVKFFLNKNKILDWLDLSALNRRHLYNQISLINIWKHDMSFNNNKKKHKYGCRVHNIINQL